MQKNEFDLKQETVKPYMMKDVFPFGRLLLLTTVSTHVSESQVLSNSTTVVIFHNVRA